MCWVLRRSAQQGKQQRSRRSAPLCRKTPTCVLLGLPKLCKTAGECSEPPPPPGAPPACPRRRCQSRVMAPAHAVRTKQYPQEQRSGSLCRGSASSQDYSRGYLLSTNLCPPILPSSPKRLVREALFPHFAAEASDAPRALPSHPARKWQPGPTQVPRSTVSQELWVPEGRGSHVCTLSI